MKKYLNSIISMILMIIGIYILTALCLKYGTLGDIDYLDLNDQVNAVITKADGTKIDVNGMALPNMDAGDEVVFTVDLPQKPFEGENALCFYQYHSEITVVINGLTVYEYGQELTRDGKMYGNEYCIVPLPESFWGHRASIIVKQMEAKGSSHFTYFRAMKLSDARLYPLIGNALQFVLFGMTLVLSLCLFVICIINKYVSGNNQPWFLITIAMFCFWISVWQLSYRRLFYLMIGNNQISALSEYYSLYLAPIPLFTYLGAIKKNRWIKCLYYIIATIYTLAFAFIVGMRQFANVHLADFESMEYILLFTSLILTIYMEVFYSRRDREQNNILRNGILLSMVLVLIQIGLLFLKNYLIDEHWIIILQRMDLSSAAILLYMGALVFSTGQTAIETVRQSAAEEQIRKLAYEDSLTGIPNRLYCDEKLDDLEHKDTFSIVFLDVDFLKRANDEYGHEMGDKLIKTVAEIIRKCSENTHIEYGRWGGDEFLVLTDSAAASIAFTKRLKKTIQEMNERKALPFDISISYGVASSDLVNPKSPKDVRNEADTLMYQYKTENRRGR